MADYLTNTTELTSIANAIRAKGNTSESLVYPQGFITGINNITTGNSNIFSFTNGSKTTTMTLIDGLQTDYQTMKNDEYPSLNLEAKLGRSLSQNTFIGALLNLQINTSPQYNPFTEPHLIIDPNLNVDVTIFLNQWSLNYTLPDQDQTSPWLIGAYCLYLQDGGPSISANLNGDNNFPNIRINKKDSNGEPYKIRFRFSFDQTYTNYSGGSSSSGYLNSYSIENLYSIIIIEQNPTD